MRSRKERNRYDSTVYYSPEDWGLKQEATIDYSSRSYEFDLRVVWRDEDGVLWSGRDSGYSCPSPFEDFNEESDFERVTPEWVAGVLIPELKGNSRGWGGDDYNKYITREEADEFLGKVRGLLPQHLRSRVPQSVI